MLHNAITKGLEREEIAKLFAHCRKIVSLFHSSQPYRTNLKKMLKDLKIPEQQLVNDVVTRWGSKYKMLQRIKHLMPATNQIFMDDRKYRDLTLNWQDAALIDVLLKCLEGFSVLTDSLSGEKAVTISSSIPMLRHIHQLCQTADDEDLIAVHVKDFIKNYLEHRLTDGDLMMFLRVAEVLDPRYHQLSRDDTSQASLWLNLSTLNEVKKYIIENAPEIVEAKPGVAGEISDNEPPQKKGKKSLVDLLMSSAKTTDDVDNATRTQGQAEDFVKKSLEDELDCYLRKKADRDSDVLKWWKTHREEFPTLAKYARYVLSSCASSVPSERLFSMSGNIITKKRNALKPSMVDQLVFLAMNKDMI